MKKYLMSGIAAVALCAAFTSCSSHDLYSEDNVTEYQKAQVQRNYETAFIATFGQPAKNQDWGFGSSAKARTRAAEFGWEVSSGYDAEFSKEYFDAIEANMPEQSKTSGNRDYEFLSKGPFQFSVIFSCTSGADAIGYYYYKASEGIESRQEVAFIDNVQNISNYFQYCQPNNNTKEDVWVDPQPQNGYQIWDWGATKVRAKVYTVNVPAGYRVGFWIENKSAGYPTFYSNKSLNPEGEAYSAVVDQDGTFLVGLEDWLRSAGGDNDCNDIIMSVSKGSTPPEVIVPSNPDPVPSDPDDVCIIAEDLSASEAGDFDFNDVVFTVHYTSESTADVTIYAAGGTLPLTVAGHEVHAELGYGSQDSDTGLYKMINTGAKADVNDVSTATFSVSGIDKSKRGNDIAILVNKGKKDENGTFKDNWIELEARQGVPAAKLCVDTSFATAHKWCNERESISSKYPTFAQWVTENPAQIWWY